MYLSFAHSKLLHVDFHWHKETDMPIVLLTSISSKKQTSLAFPMTPLMLLLSGGQFHSVSTT